MDKRHLTIQQAIDRLIDSDTSLSRRGPLPSVESVREIISLTKAILFPALLDVRRYEPNMSRYFTGVNIDLLFSLLVEQIERSLVMAHGCDDGECDSEGISLSFIEALPEIREILMTDVHAMYLNDPAAVSEDEVIFCYPGANAMMHYRCAHFLLNAGVPLLPRIITEQAHSLTGIDIHPGAQIDKFFSIDHGTGIVIGQTCHIGKHVQLYQGVTLGARNFTLDQEGHPMNIPRHPTIEDHVTIYSNSSVLGNITIGHHSTIGGNLWISDNIPPHSRIVQGLGRNVGH